MPFERVWVRYENGQQHGPAGIEDVKNWARNRQIPDECWLVDAESGACRPLSDFPEITILMPAQGLEGVIPKNKWALFGYYTAVFSWVGVFLCGLPGFLMGVTAVWLGVKGLAAQKRNPLLRGKGHSWTAIICGGLAALVGFAFFAAMLIGLSGVRRHSL